MVYIVHVQPVKTGEVWNRGSLCMFSAPRTLNLCGGYFSQVRVSLWLNVCLCCWACGLDTWPRARILPFSMPSKENSISPPQACLGFGWCLQSGLLSYTSQNVFPVPLLSILSCYCFLMSPKAKHLLFVRDDQVPPVFMVKCPVTYTLEHSEREIT